MLYLVSLENYPGKFLPLFLYAYVYPGINTSTPSFNAETHCMFMNILCEGNKKSNIRVSFWPFLERNKSQAKLYLKPTISHSNNKC